MQYRSTTVQTKNQQQFCLHSNTEIKVKPIKLLKDFPYVVSVGLDIMVDDVVTFPEYSSVREPLELL